MEESVYIVYYVMGSYDDYTETNYKVCFSKETADELTNYMNDSAKEYGLHERVKSLQDSEICQAYDANQLEFCKKYNVRYIDPLTGVEFKVQELEVYRDDNEYDSLHR